MNRMTLICRSSKILNRVTKSPLALETLAFSEVADAGVLIAAMQPEIFRQSRLPEVLCKTNNAETGRNFKVIKSSE